MMKEERKKAGGVQGNESKVAERVKRWKKTKDEGVVVGNRLKKEKFNKVLHFCSVESS